MSVLTISMFCCAALGGAATIIAFGSMPGYGAALAVGGAVCFVNAAVALRQLHGKISLAAKVLEGAALGNLEQRLIYIGNGNDMLSRLYRSANGMLDAADSFVRESNASLREVSAGRFHRRILSTGMHRSYKHSATTINGMTQSLEVRFHENKKLAEEFRQSVNAHIATVTGGTQQTKEEAAAMQTATTEAVHQSHQVADVANATLREADVAARASVQLSRALSDVRDLVAHAADI
ncbi:MAG: hypothetical protein JZU63_08370, partial [Rhodoferax sp.]|nr:hypothetical protein [Rhodoferax sp.]